jgi:hypothetical protein
MTTKKVVGIESGKKPDEPCKFCGKTPACPGWTCSRLAAVVCHADGSYEVEFVLENPPPEIHIYVSPDDFPDDTAH